MCSFILDDGVEGTSIGITDLEVVADSNGTDVNILLGAMASLLTGNKPVARNPLFKCSGLKEQSQSFAIKPIYINKNNYILYHTSNKINNVAS